MAEHPKDPCGPCGDAFGAPVPSGSASPSPVCTFCNGDRKDNVWVEGVTDVNGNGGICMLDSLTEQEIIGIIEVDDRARADLKRVTTDPTLLHLANTIPRLPTTEEGDILQKQTNQNSIPFYSIFRGQPPFAQ